MPGPASTLPAMVAAVTAAVGALVLVGHAGDSVVLKSLFLGLPTMRPNAALGFLLAGLALYLASRGGDRQMVGRAVLSLGGIVFALGTLTAAQHVLGVDLGIDDLVLAERSPLAHQSPGRMSLPAAVGLTLAGIALLARGPAGARLAAMAAVALASLGFVELSTFGGDAVFGLQRWHPEGTALHTAGLMCLLGVGLLFHALPATGQWAISRRVTLMLGVGLALVLATTGFAFRAVDRSAMAHAAVLESLSVLRAADQLRVASVGLHAHIRDMVLTGQPSHAVAARARLPEIAAALATLRELKGHDLALQARLDALESALEQRLDLGRETLSRFEAGRLEAARDLVTGGLGPSLMSAIEAHLLAIAVAELSELSEREGSAVTAAALVGLLLPLGAALSLLVLCGAFVAANREALGRARREAELRQANAAQRFLGSVVERTTQPFAAVDLDGRFTRVNPAFERLTGYSRAELAAMHINDLTPERWHAMEGRLIAEELIGRRRSVRFEKEYRRKDGSIVPIELVADAFVGESGRIECLYAFVSDLTERRQMHERLRAEQERFRLLLDSISEGIYGLDNEGRCTFINPPALTLLGYGTADEVLGRNMHDLIHHTHVDGARYESATCPIFRSFREGAAAHVDSEVFWRADGTSFPVEYWSSPTREDGRIAGAVVAFMDVSERKRTLAELRERTEGLARSNADLEQFAYVASHDLQEPLRAVAGSVQLLEGAYRDRLDGRALDYIRHAVEGVKRMQTLINDLLAFSRVGTRGEAFAPVRLQEALAGALEGLRVPIAETQAIVTHDALPEVPADRTQMTLLFQNLVGNALKFCRDRRPEIHVGAARNGESWVVSVRDNGIGIEPQYFDRIFVIFQRLHTRKEYHGTGIGLAICKKIVERHRGRIWVESSPGTGSTFHFSLPAKEEAG